MKKEFVNPLQQFIDEINGLDYFVKKENKLPINPAPNTSKLSMVKTDNKVLDLKIKVEEKQNLIQLMKELKNKKMIG